MNKSPSQRGRNNRRKGAQEERDIKNDLKIFYPNIDRKTEYRQVDIDGRDLINSGIFDIQIKNVDGFIPKKVYDALEKFTTKGHKVVISKGMRKKRLVTMYYDEWKVLLEMLGDKIRG